MSALGGGRGILAGMSAGGGGMDPGGGGGAGADPDQILSQIRSLLDQYLALGPDTPVAAEAQQLSDAIDAHQGGGAAPDAGAPPADPTADPTAEEAVPGEQQAPTEEPDLGGASDLPPPEDMPGKDNTSLHGGEKGYKGGDQKEARSQATDFLKKRNKKGK